MEPVFVIFLLAALVWGLVLWQRLPEVGDDVVVVAVSVLMVVQCFLGAEFLKYKIGPFPLTLDRLMLGLLLLWAVRRVIQNRVEQGGPGPWHLPDLAVSVWIGVLVASTLTHDFGFRDHLPLTRLLFFNLLPATLYAVIRQIRWTKSRVEVFQWGMVILGLLLSLVGMLEWMGLHSWVWPRHIVDPDVGEFLGRARGPLQNPVINGMLMNAGLASAIVLTWNQRGMWKPVLYFSVPILLAGSFATLTRSVWVAATLTTGFALLAPMNWRQRFRFCTVTAIAGFCLLALFSDKLNRFKRDRDVSVEEMAQSVTLRPLLWTVAMDMFSEKPVFGFGFGQYPNHKRPYHYSDHHQLPLTKVLPYMQHNVVLSYATETGLTGILALGGLLASIALAAVRLMRTNLAPHRAQGVMTICGLSSYLVNGMFHDVSIIPMGHTLLLAHAGLAIGLLAASRDEGSVRQKAVPEVCLPGDSLVIS